ncbi:MAG: RNA 2',3'-cyclic phosphodiesterase [Patescibacteria group bacterium]|jgi:2'-5' RNA ligase|nr:RNA 2',3'-cyclic phosphodiesterase [Patescibacteria group bacterium]MDD5172719.1 RNA 2',3'-cyclic phosphodiesterase [Patescibacteria group bacterium]
MKIRSFIAVNLPMEVKEILEKRIKEIKKEIKIGIKWVKKENLHLTLHFLGELENREIEKVKDILRKMVISDKIRLKIGQIGHFSRILFFKCREVEEHKIFDLQKNIGQELKKIGLKIDQRPWQMHLTFGRAKTSISISDSFLNQKIEEKEFFITSIDLMKSELKISGPIYTIIKKFPVLEFRI